MLKFNPNRMMALRGIDRMFGFLHKNGFVRSTANFMLKGAASSIKVEHIEKLCVLLNCTPNDLFYWNPDTNNPLPENHALYALKREHQSVKNYKELLMNIPPEKLPEVENLLESLQDG